MQHSQLRRPNEPVKLFAKTSSTQTGSLEVYEFVNGALIDITPTYNIEALNTGYYSTEIVTPDHSCYLLIMFSGNPIVLRIGDPKLEFFYWAKKQKTYGYYHFDEFGVKLDDGLLTSLGLGFYYTTPISDVLGYIEVNKRPYVVHVPYCSGSVGVGIDIDWKRTIIRQQFGLDVTKLNFKLNKKIHHFSVKKKVLKFSLSIRNQKHFSVDVKKLKFKIYCRS